MTPEQILRLEAENLTKLAAMLGMNVEIVNAPLHPLAMGNTTPVVTVWQTRKSRNALDSFAADPVGFTRDKISLKEAAFMVECAPGFTRETNGMPSPTPRPISDREWATYEPAN